MDDKVNNAFSLAYTIPHDGVPQPHVIPFDNDKEVNDIQKYTPAHVHQKTSLTKQVCFSK